jgi:hypothetical protein
VASDPSERRPTRLAVPRWLGPLFFVLALVMVPWTVYLAFALPSRHLAGNYRAAWVGFDIALLVALAVTGWYVWRGRTRVELPAIVTGTLLVVDGWFDVLTSHGAEEVYAALASAFLLELPLAAVCFWIALHAERVRTYRFQLLRARAVRHGVTVPGSTSDGPGAGGS